MSRDPDAHVNSIAPSPCWLKLIVRGSPGFRDDRHFADTMPKNSMFSADNPIKSQDETEHEDHAPVAIVRTTETRWADTESFVPRVFSHAIFSFEQSKQSHCGT